MGIKKLSTLGKLQVSLHLHLSYLGFRTYLLSLVLTAHLANFELEQACPTYYTRAIFCTVRLFDLHTYSFKTFALHSNFLFLLIISLSSENIFEKYHFDLQKKSKEVRTGGRFHKKWARGAWRVAQKVLVAARIQLAKLFLAQSAWRKNYWRRAKKIRIPS